MKNGMITLLIILGIILLLVVAFLGFSKIYPLSLKLHKQVNQQNGIALSEYDVVSFFNSEEPVKGYGIYAHDWNGVTWLFSSQKNLATFIENPKKYTPQYGGYCTKAISSGFAAPASPEVYTIQEGKLYFFSSSKVKEDFLINTNKQIKSCNKKWNSN